MDEDGNPADAWVCPNDRQLALRAKYIHWGKTLKTISHYILLLFFFVGGSDLLHDDGGALMGFRVGGVTQIAFRMVGQIQADR